MQWYFLKHPPRCQQFASEPKGLPLYSVALGVFNTLSFSSSPLEPGKLLAKVCHSHLWRQYCSSSPTVYFHLPGASGRADLVLRKQQPWCEESQRWERLHCRALLQLGYHLAAPHTQKRFAWRYFPNDTLDMGNLAHGMVSSLETSITEPVTEFHIEFIHHGEQGGLHEAWQRHKS